MDPEGRRTSRVRDGRLPLDFLGEDKMDARIRSAFGFLNRLCRARQTRPIICLMIGALMFASAALRQSVAKGNAWAADGGSPQAAPSAGATSLAITPAAIIVQVGEAQKFRLADDQKRPIRDAAWSVSDPALAEIEADGDAATVVGRTRGKITVTATWKGLAAHARVTFIGEATAAGEPSAIDSEWLRVTPDMVGALVGDSHLLRLVDEKAHPITDAHWSIDNSTVAEITPGPDATVSFRAPGSARVTAEWQNRRAYAQIIVYPGVSLPVGTHKWSVKELPGFATAKITPAVPSAGGPDIFASEVDGCGRTVVRAILEDGRELWRSLVSRGNTQTPPDAGLGSPAFAAACTLPPPRK
jgi:hypothetical protein